MALTISQGAVAVAPRIKTSFAAAGGVAPYTFAVLPGGAGGTINAATGLYTAPVAYSSENPLRLYDTIQVTDDVGAIAISKILVGSPLMLFCQIIEQELGLASGRVYLWDQKIMQPTDSGLYIAVSVGSSKPFGSSNRMNAEGISEQFVSMLSILTVDVISRGASARDRKEEVILALESDYARRQQDANSFFVGKISDKFINISEVDGAAIPYRFRINISIQYAYAKARPTLFFDQFSPSSVDVKD